MKIELHEAMDFKSKETLEHTNADNQLPQVGEFAEEKSLPQNDQVQLTNNRKSADFREKTTIRSNKSNQLIDHRFHNMLIDPLQPLTTPLSLSVYDEFMKDEIKYNQYKLAIELALFDLQYLPSINVLVVGPGKGKLIDKLLSIDGLPKNLNIYAIEINTKCEEFLHWKNSNQWDSIVSLIFDDIRTCPIAFTPNIIISELLGSFGDNELCPEILSRFDDESIIMIPSSYRSFLQPIHTSIDIVQKNRPYLIFLTNYSEIGEYKPIWEFLHPSSNLVSRSSKVSFCCQIGKINGFYGYFNANLYGHINIHINPQSKLETYCKSWYPIIFPVHEIDVERGQIVEFELTRFLDLRVWYEWKFNGVTYNKGGELYSMALNN